jgi:hypothetical protein
MQQDHDIPTISAKGAEFFSHNASFQSNILLQFSQRHFNCPVRQRPQFSLSQFSTSISHRISSIITTTHLFRPSVPRYMTLLLCCCRACHAFLVSHEVLSYTCRDAPSSSVLDVCTLYTPRREYYQFHMCISLSSLSRSSSWIFALMEACHLAWRSIIIFLIFVRRSRILILLGASSP